MKLGITLAVTMLALCLNAAGQTRLVIGNNGTTLVQTTCTKNVAAGVSEVSFDPLPPQASPESVSLSEPAGTAPVKLVFQKTSMADRYAEPGGTRGLVYTVDAPTAGNRTFTLTYLLVGLNWQADYNAFLSADRKSVRLEGWITLSNQTGCNYTQPTIKLARSYTNTPGMGGMSGMGGMGGMMGPGGYPMQQMGETGFVESSLIPLEGVETISPMSSVRIPLVNTAAVAITPYLQCEVSDRDFHGEQFSPEFSGMRAKTPGAWWWVELDNAEQLGAKKLLPGGSFRVLQETAQGPLLSSTGMLDEAGPGQKLRIKLVPESGVTAKRQMKQDHGGMMMQGNPGEAGMVRSIVLTSTLDGPREVRVLDRPEPGGRSDVPISNASDKYKKLEDGRLEFRVEVIPGTERVITYTLGM